MRHLFRENYVLNIFFYLSKNKIQKINKPYVLLQWTFFSLATHTIQK